MPQGLAIATVDVSFPLLAPDGSAAAPSYSFAAATNAGMYNTGFGAIGISFNGAQQVSIGVQDFRVNGSLSIDLAGTVNLVADAANVLAQRNGVATQTFRLGNSAACPAIADYAGGLSIIVNCLVGVNNGFPVWLFDTAGSLSPHVAYNNAIDIGASGRVPRSIYAGTSMMTPVLYLGTSTNSYINESLGINLVNVDLSRTMSFSNQARTSATPGFLFQETWNDAGVTFIGVDTNITATLSAAGSLIERWRVGGSQVAGLRSDGVMYANYLGLAALNTSTLNVYLQSNSSGLLTMYSGAGAGLTSLSFGTDITLGNLAAASLRLGAAPSATPVAQTFTVGEASRPGTDSNVGGANGTIRSGLGTGTGTVSSLIFQTPTLAAGGSGTQSYGTRLTIDSDVKVNSSAALIVNGNRIYFRDDNGLFVWGAADDLILGRLGAAYLRQGGPASATPVAQTFSLGESSRGTTDNNVAGANGTLRCGAGTGNAAGASLIFETPTPTASGVVAQAYAQRLSLSVLGATFDIPDQGLRINNQVNGAGASAGTLTNAPAAGNPNFWLPVNVNGTVYMFPGW